MAGREKRGRALDVFEESRRPPSEPYCSKKKTFQNELLESPTLQEGGLYGLESPAMQIGG